MAAPKRMSRVLPHDPVQLFNRCPDGRQEAPPSLCATISRGSMVAEFYSFLRCIPGGVAIGELDE